jgi:predicted transcriptional regulator
LPPAPPRHINARNKASEANRLHTTYVVSSLFLEGKTLTTIANELGISYPTVAKLIREAKQQWQIRAEKNYAEHIASELARLDKVEAEAWQAWHESKKSSRSVSETTGGEKPSKTKRKDSQTGDPRMLAVIQKCVEQRMKILGLDGDSSGKDGDQSRQILEVVISTRDEKESFEKIISLSDFRSQKPKVLDGKVLREIETEE